MYSFYKKKKTGKWPMVDWQHLIHSWVKYFSNVLECGNSTLGTEESNIFLIPLEEKKKKKKSPRNVALIHSGNKNKASKFLSCHAFKKEEENRKRMDADREDHINIFPLFWIKSSLLASKSIN